MTDTSGRNTPGQRTRWTSTDIHGRSGSNYGSRARNRLHDPRDSRPATMREDHHGLNRQQTRGDKMSQWSDYDLEARIIEILSKISPTGHHFGRPYATPYQIAILLITDYPELKNFKDVGGAGAGKPNSLSQYVAHQLSVQIKAKGNTYPIEGAFLSSRSAKEISFIDHEGRSIVSSLTGSGFDLSLFRLRDSI